MPKFKISSKFKPAGDQGQAIAKLAKSVKAGDRYQTLLGVTGSGKSLTPDEPLLIYCRGKSSLIPIGEVIDDIIEKKKSKKTEDGTTIVQANQNFSVLSFNAANKKAEIKKIQQFIRHKSPDVLYKITTACGREIKATGDHNFFVLRGGNVELIKTSEIRDNDYLPLPRQIIWENKELQHLNLLNWLSLKDFFIAPNNEFIELLKTEKRKIWEILNKKEQWTGYQKVYRIIKHKERISLQDFKKIIQIYPQVLNNIEIESKNSAVKIPLLFSLNAVFLKFLGIYIAEGCASERYITISSNDKELILICKLFAKQAGMHIAQRKKLIDYQISSIFLAKFLVLLCGKGAEKKHLPVFWMNLSKKQLGVLLAAYFSGDGTVDQKEISCVTASKKLASELSYALLKFGILARIRQVKKRPTNVFGSKKKIYWGIFISGQKNLQLFQKQIGFILERKNKLVAKMLNKKYNTNVDVIPQQGDKLKKLRELLNVSQQEVVKFVKTTRSNLSLIENNKRRPSYNIFCLLLRSLELKNKLAKNDEINSKIKELKEFANVFWTPIKSVEKIKSVWKYVYDISVEGNETFFGGFGGLFVHNTFTIANVIEKTQKPTLVIAHNKTLAAQLASEFRQFFPNNVVEYFVSYYDYYQPEAYLPTTDTYIEKESQINEEIERLRHKATSALLSRKDVIIVASVSCIYGLGSPEKYKEIVLRLEQGMKKERDEVISWLVDMYFTRSDVLSRGQFSAKGNVLEIMPMGEEFVYRVEFDEDICHCEKSKQAHSVINKISVIDALTRNVLEEVSEVSIFPTKHFVVSQNELERAIKVIQQELEDRLKVFNKEGKLLEAERLERRTKQDIAMMREVGYCNGIENYSRHLIGKKAGEPPYTLIDYFPKDFLVVIDESHVTIPQIGGMYAGDRSRKDTLVEHGFRLPSAKDNRPLRFDEFEEKVKQAIFVSATPAKFEAEHSAQVVEQIIRPTGLVDPEIIIRPVVGQVDNLIGEIEKVVNPSAIPEQQGCHPKLDSGSHVGLSLRGASRRRGNLEMLKQVQHDILVGGRVLITTLTKKSAENLSDYLKELNFKVAYLHSEVDTLDRIEIIRKLRLGDYDCLVGVNLLREGLDMPEVSLVAILDADKEGFLRSQTSLIQTIGRAARNVRGRVILYADNMTGSIKRAIEETDRRREKQIAYNKKHHITPKTIQKKIETFIDHELRPIKPAKEYIDLENLEDLPRVIKEKEKQMKQLAKDLKFEDAAMLRDEILTLRRIERK